MRWRHDHDDRFYRALVLLVVLAAGVLVWLHWRNTREAPPPGSTEGRRAPVPERSEWVRHPGAHEVVDSSRCFANTGRDLAPARPIHRWIDAHGVVHFSDRPPAAGEAREHSLRHATGVPPVAVTMRTFDAHLPPHAVSTAIADSVGIGKVLRDGLGLDTGGGLSLTVALAGSDEAFRALAPEARSVSGVYLGDRRLIVVRAQSSHEATMDVLRHEIAHALVHEWIGRLPTALNEGLADYFESLRVQGLGGSVDPARYARQLQGDIPPGDDAQALVHLLHLPNPAFHSHQRSRNYTHSLGLVSTLMATPERRRALAAVLQAQRTQPCRSVDAASLLNRTWPGGLEALAAAWREHHAGRDAGVHSY